MGSYASLAVRDPQGNIVGYQSTATGEIVEGSAAPSLAFQQTQAQYAQQKYMSIGGAGAYQQSAQPMYVPENIQFAKSAAGIAAEVYLRGGQGAVDIGVAGKAIQEGMPAQYVNVAGVTAQGQRINTPVFDVLAGTTRAVGIETGVQQGKAWTPNYFELQRTMYNTPITAEQLAAVKPPFMSASSPAIAVAPTEIPGAGKGTDWYAMLGLGGSEAGQRAYQNVIQGRLPTTEAGVAQESRIAGSKVLASVPTITTVGVTGGADIGSPLIGTGKLATAPMGVGTATFPYGRERTTVLENVKLGVDPDTGELAAYQQVRPGSAMYNLIGGGSRYAAQSGEFTFESPVTGKINLASLATPGSENFSKYAAPGANIPWSVASTTPTLFTMSPSGIGSAVNVPASAMQGTEGRLIGGKTVAAVATTTPVSGELPAPYISPSVGTQKPTGELFGAKVPVVSDVLAFFQPSEKVTTSYQRSTIPEVTTLKETKQYQTPQGIVTENIYETTGGAVGTQTVTKEQMPSGFESWLAGANKIVADVTGLSKLPTPTTEQIKATSPYLAGLGQAPFAVALQTPIVGDYAASYLKGEIGAAKEKPVTFGVSTGVGFAFGLGAKGVETAVGLGRAAAAEKIISEGRVFRAGEVFSGSVMKYAPIALGGLYVADVGGRATLYGQDLTPAAAERFGGIVSTEARPMLFGGIAGYAAPEATYRAARFSDIGYKSAVQEGTATGRLDYYVKQPVSSAIDVVSKPYRELKLDYQSFVQERTPTARSFTPEQRIEQDILKIQKEAFVPGSFENAYIYSKVTGERLAGPIKGISQDEIAGSDIQDVFNYIMRVRPESETFALYHTHPPDLAIPRLTKGFEMLKSGQITPTQFVKGSIDVITAGERYTTPSMEDIRAARYSSTNYGVSEEGVISVGKVAKFSSEVQGAKSTPSKLYSVYSESVGRFGAEYNAARESMFLSTGTELGFKPSIRTTAEIESGLPKTPGVSEYIQYRAERAIGSAKISTGSFFQELPGRVERAGTAVLEPYVRARVVGEPTAVAGVQSAYLGYKFGAPKEYKIVPEFQRAAIAPEDEFALGSVYGRTTKIGDIPRMAEIGVKSYFQERAQPEGAGIFYLSTKLWMPKGAPAAVTSGVAGEGAAAVAKTKGAGTGATPFTRVTTTKVGGKTISTLAREPSLKSMGVAERAMPTSTGIGGAKVTDYRGRPTSAGMKPMDLSGTKQAAGQQAIALTEQLPAVEGMTVGRFAPPAQATRVGIGVAPQFAFEEAQAMEVSPATQAQRPRVGVVSVLQPAFATDMVKAQSEVKQAQEREYATVYDVFRTPVLGQTQAERQMPAVTTDIMQVRTPASRVTTDITRDYDRAYRMGYATDTAFRQDITTIPTQRVTTRQDIITTTYPTITPVPPTPIPPFVPPFGDFFAGGGSFGGGARRRRPFREILPIGLDISTFGPKTQSIFGGRKGGWAKVPKVRPKKLKLTRKK